MFETFNLFNMNVFTQNIPLVSMTLQAVIVSLINKYKEWEFEITFIISLVFCFAFIILNLSSLIKFIYYLKNKNNKFNSSKSKNTNRQIKINKTKSNIFKRLFVKIWTKLKCLFYKLIIIPFSPKCFFERSFYPFEINIWKLHVKIKYILIWTIKILLIDIAIIFFIFNNARSKFKSYPSYHTIYPEENGIWNDYTRPIEIAFSVPIDKNSLIINMRPENAGEWKFESCLPYLPFTRRIKYYPDETIFPGQDIMIYLTDLTNHFHTMNGGEHLVKFYSISLPEIETIIPENESINVPINTQVTLSLNQKDGPYIDWEFIFDKQVEFDIQRNNNSQVILFFKNTLKQGEKYKLDTYITPLSSNVETGEVLKKGEKQLFKTIEFTTVPAPLIQSFEPVGSTVLTDTKIKVIFDNDMDKQSIENSFTINPETEGTITWDDDKTFIFTPKVLAKETHYEITLKKGILSIIGGVSEEDIVYTFDTIGAVKVIGWSPGYGSGNIRINTQIRITFDQQVDHASAEERFSISPSINGNFSWSGNTMILTPSDSLSYSTNYNFSIGTGVKTVYGYDSRQSFSSHFTTESNIFSLNVPLYRQAHAFTCNITAIAMGLSYSGAPSSEMSVYNSIQKDNTPCTKDGTKITVWGNPHVGYVGNIDGAGECGGYGIYWEAASVYVSNRGVSNRVYTGWNVASLAGEVENGHPAVIWWQNGWASPFDKSWYTPNGQNIHAINGMHSEVVIGFIGPSSNPSHIITNDPWRGRRTLTVSYFNSMWGYFNRTALVFY